MYETVLTAVGRVATTVATHRFGDGALKATFRVACNERRRDWSTGQWVDGDTLFLSVSCWRALAENVEASLKVGDPVIVRGRMYTREYETEGRRASVVELEAYSVGPDLGRCTTTVTRRPAAAQRSPEAVPESAPAGERVLVAVGGAPDEAAVRG